MRNFLRENLYFLVTNRIPRRWLTLCIGRLSPCEQPFVRWLSFAIWRRFCNLELDDALETRFPSMQACFTRALRPGTRPIDQRADVLVSPCDGIIGAHGPITAGQMFQAKGYPYALDELLGGPAPACWADGYFVTLRITAGMYHRFHAPATCTATRVTYLAGDTWNVHPIALRRIERLFCRNERAIVELELECRAEPVALVAVAAVLVASIRLHFLDLLLHLRYDGPQRIACTAPLVRGEEMGWFEHGSTIIVLAPRGYCLQPGLENGSRVNVGEALLSVPTASSTRAASSSGPVVAVT